MLETTLNNTEDKLLVRCTKCDREMDHYVTFTSAVNGESNICWECTDRKEKGLNTKRSWKRGPRQEPLIIEAAPASIPKII